MFLYCWLWEVICLKRQMQQLFSINGLVWYSVVIRNQSLTLYFGVNFGGSIRNGVKHLNCAFYDNSLSGFWIRFCHLCTKNRFFSKKIFTKFETVESPLDYTEGMIHLVIRKIICKTNISYLLIRTSKCAYQVVRNDSFSETFASILNEWFVICNWKEKEN